MNPDPCRAWRESLGALALGHLTGDEREAVEQHASSCAECRSELEQLRAVVALLPEADPGRVAVRTIQPPPQLKEKVLARIDQIRREEGPRVLPRPPWPRVVAGLAAAAVVGALTFAVVRSNAPDAPVGVASRTPTSITSPPVDRLEIEFVDEPGGAEATAVLVAMDGQTEIELQVASMPSGRYLIVLEALDGTVVEAGQDFGAHSGNWHGRRLAPIPLEDASEIRVVQVEGGETVIEAALT
jgi:hypothetical protein